MLACAHCCARLDPRLRTPVQNLDAGPVAAHVDQDVGALRLSVQRGARGAEHDRPVVLAGVPEHRGDVVGGLGDHHHLRDEAVRTGVSGIPHQVGKLVQHLAFAKEADEVFPEGVRRARGTVLGHAVDGRTAGGSRSQRVGFGVEKRHVSLRSLGGRPAQPLGLHAAFGTRASEGLLLWGGEQSRRTGDSSTYEVEVRPCFHRRAEVRLVHPLIHWQGSLICRPGHRAGGMARTDAVRPAGPRRGQRRGRGGVGCVSGC